MDPSSPPPPPFHQILMDVKRVKKDYDRSFYSGVGLGLHYRVLGMDKGFNPLRVEDVARAYRQANHRVVMLDYGGTLVAGSEKTENVQVRGCLMVGGGRGNTIRWVGRSVILCRIQLPTYAIEYDQPRRPKRTHSTTPFPTSSHRGRAPARRSSPH